MIARAPGLSPIRKLVVACLLALPVSPALAQELWQDGQYAHAYDTYLRCYERAIETGAAVGADDQSATDKLFTGAFRSCAPQRAAGTALALARISVLKPDYSPEKREQAVAASRRALVVLELQKFLDRKGLGSQFEDHLKRTAEY